MPRVTAVYTKNGTQAGDGERLAKRAVLSVSQSKPNKKIPTTFGGAKLEILAKMENIQKENKTTSNHA